MNSYWVVVADATRARFLTLEEFPKASPSLKEHKDLINPESDERGRDLWSDLKTGRGRATGGGPAHGYDDHRCKHEDEFERRFARKVTEEIASVIRSRPVKQIIVVAEKQMLGFLRPSFVDILKDEVEVREVPKDLSKLNTTDLHKRLAKEGLLPPRTIPRARR